MFIPFHIPERRIPPEDYVKQGLFIFHNKPVIPGSLLNRTNCTNPSYFSTELQAEFQTIDIYEFRFSLNSDKILDNNQVLKQEYLDDFEADGNYENKEDDTCRKDHTAEKKQ